VSPTRKASVAVLGLWAVLLSASHWARWREESALRSPGVPVAEVPAIDGDEVLSGQVTVAYGRWGEDGGNGLPLVLLHGSPSRGGDFRNLAPYLARDRLVIAPHLPGFGASTRKVPDYSLRAHANYVIELLDELGIERCHVLGFSMGGGVVLEMTDLAEGRVASVVLLSALGVQEMELLGSYSLNHMIHGLQLLGLWSALELVPHFGRWDGGMVSIEYARNFYDTDQRPLRRRLLDLEAPALIVHGRDDFLVPPEAAVEHHRLMPHSELQMLDDNHFLPFRPRPDLPDRLSTFLERVESGEARTRARAEPGRVARAALPFNPADTPRWTGPAILVVFLLLGLATFVSEDLTCIGAGLLVAQGRMTLLTAILACFVGIFVGDLLLYAAGRYLGRPVLSLPPFRWWVKEKAFEESTEWFRRRGAIVIGLGRFVPGTRLPTYLAAGILKMGFVRCSFHFFLAAAVWTPLLVGLALVTGSTALARVEGLQRQSLVLLFFLVVLLWMLRGFVVPLFSWKGRRRLLGFWRRWSRWECWPEWLLYPPLLVYLVFLGLRYRGLTVFTAANPAMPAGGVLGESKAEIFAGLAGAGEAVPL
jgi:pimeloyl-ACP methyl ester carboxylesterase/membrane protein DedA with SNARE-associated domain